MDMSALSDADLQAISKGDMAAVSDAGLAHITGKQAVAQPIAEVAKPARQSLLERWLGKRVAGDIGAAVQDWGNVAAGAAKGASGIGAVLMHPLDSEARARIGRDVNYGLSELGAEPETGLYKAGEVVAEIAGTAGAGGMLAKPIMGIAPKLAASLASGGLSLGRAPAATSALSAEGLANAATRVGGGAVTGAAMSGLTDPENMGMGAGIGGVLGAVSPLAGKAYKSITGKMTSSPNVVELAKKAEQLGIDIPADRLVDSPALNAMAASLRYIPGSGRVATETAMNNQIKRELSKTFGEDTEHIGKDLIARSRERLGKGFDETLKNNNVIVDDELRHDLYGALKKAKLEMGDDARLKTLQSQVDALMNKAYDLPVKSSGLSQAEFEAINAGRQTHPDLILGGEAPVMEEKTLLSDIRKLGGVSTKDMADLIGEKATNKSGAQVGVFTKNGEEVGDMVRRLVDKGTLPKSILEDVDGGAQHLRDKIQAALNPQYDKNMASFGPQSADDILPGAFKEGSAAKPLAGEFEKSNEISGKAAYDTKMILDRLSRSSDVSMAHHAKQIRLALMKALDRSLGSEKAADFAGLRREYANMKTLEKLAGNSAEGDISMARLGNIDSRNQEVQDLARIAATFAKGRESPHGAMQRISMGGGLAAALGGGAIAGIAAPVAVGLTAGRLANIALNNKGIKNLIMKQKSQLSDIDMERLSNANALTRAALLNN